MKPELQIQKPRSDAHKLYQKNEKPQDRDETFFEKILSGVDLSVFRFLGNGTRKSSGVSTNGQEFLPEGLHFESDASHHLPGSYTRAQGPPPSHRLESEDLGSSQQNNGIKAATTSSLLDLISEGAYTPGSNISTPPSSPRHNTEGKEPYLKSIKDGRIDKHRRKRPLLFYMYEEKKKKSLHNMIANYSRGRSGGFQGSEKDWSDMVNYAQQVFTASQSLEGQLKRSTAHQNLLTSLRSREVIEILDDNSVQRSIIGRSPAPFSVSSRASSIYSDSPLRVEDLSASRSAYSPTIRPKLGRLNVEQSEPEWLTDLRYTLQESSNSETKAPAFNALKKQDEQRQTDIERRRNPPSNSLPKLNDQDRAEVKAILHATGSVVDAFGFTIMRKDIKTLLDKEWLNDEIINFYFTLIKQRASEKQGILPKVHNFNTFFYPTLLKEKYDKVKRWTKKVDIFSFDYIIIPVHLGMHWCCGIINFLKKRIEYYDSMHGNNHIFLQEMRKYLNDESMDKKKKPFPLDEWVDYDPKNIPYQENGYDCGVFTCMFAEYVSRSEPFDFEQANIKQIRERMIFEIAKAKLMERIPVKSLL